MSLGNSTIFQEIGRYKCQGDYTKIQWRCDCCGSIITLPQQQHFRYCLWCGREVFGKFGGKE